MKKQFDLSKHDFSVKNGVLTITEKTPKYPTCFEELSKKYQDKLTKFNAFVPKKYLSLNKLEQFRNAWNEIDSLRLIGIIQIKKNGVSIYIIMKLG
jgi:hypothetical protein